MNPRPRKPVARAASADLLIRRVLLAAASTFLLLAAAAIARADAVGDACKTGVAASAAPTDAELNEAHKVAKGEVDDFDLFMATRKCFDTIMPNATLRGGFFPGRRLMVLSEDWRAHGGVGLLKDLMRKAAVKRASGI